LREHGWAEHERKPIPPRATKDREAPHAQAPTFRSSSISAMKVSIHLVEKFPEMKSGWSMMRRCRAEVVLTPSTTRVSNARRIAEWLAAHPLVHRVNYPGLASHPGRDVHERQVCGGGRKPLRGRDGLLLL